jgi:hypothetical protein
MNLHFGRKIFGQIAVIKFWTNFNPKTTHISTTYYIHMYNNLDVKVLYIQQ